MEQINKAYIYERLAAIQNEKHINTQPYIDMMIGQEEIPYKVVVFINRHAPIENFRTYNSIYDKRRKSPLFRNLLNANLPIEEKAIVLSSLLSQSLISMKHAKEEHKDAFIDTVNIDLIFKALSKYMYENDTNIIDETFETFHIIFKTLFAKKR